MFYAFDAEKIQSYLWNCYKRVFVHPCMMVQFSFWLHLVSIWSLRIGEVTESSFHRSSNEGVCYGDVTFSLVARGGGVNLGSKSRLPYGIASSQGAKCEFAWRFCFYFRNSHLSEKLSH